LLTLSHLAAGVHWRGAVEEPNVETVVRAARE
jgi:hypothetical protein